MFWKVREDRGVRLNSSPGTCVCVWVGEEWAVPGCARLGGATGLGLREGLIASGYKDSLVTGPGLTLVARPIYEERGSFKDRGTTLVQGAGGGERARVKP